MDSQSPDASWVGELLKHNHAPSEKTAQAVKGFRLKSMKELEELDAQILVLRNHLSELESKRNETQKQKSSYDSILAPIRRIPPDVLGEIFLCCLPTHRNPIMKSTDCPLLLGRVCSSWRTVVMSFPRLWERLYITFTDGDSIPDVESAAELAQSGQIESHQWKTAQTKSVKELTREVLRRRYEAVREWVARSGTRPLSMSITFGSTYWYTVPYSERPNSINMEFLSFLATLAPRLKDLELKMSFGVYKTFENMVTVFGSEMTALTSFRGEFHFQPFSDPDFPASSRIMLLLAPNLRRVSIWSNDNNMWGIPSHSSHWRKLTSISCFNTMPITQVIFILENCSNLVHYKCSVSNYERANVPIVYKGHISLPSLRTLSITEVIDPRYLGNLFDCIHAPALQAIEYINHLYSDEYDGANTEPMPIIRFLQKSNNLQKLIIDTSDFSRWDVGSMLGAVPTITHLLIGPNENHRQDSFRPLLFTNNQTSGTLDGSSWSFTDLIAHDGDDHPSLLPCLKSLVISSTAVNITDEVLVNVVKSRMTGALEHVNVVFLRVQGRDILEELTHHAKLVGAEIRLELDYAQPPALETKPISVEFGLKGKDGGSWPYLDAGENM